MRKFHIILWQEYINVILIHLILLSRLYCRATLRNSGHTWYTGTVLGINANGTYEIDYDDGDYDANVPAR